MVFGEIFSSLYFTKIKHCIICKRVPKNVVRQCYSHYYGAPYYSSEVQRQLAAGVGTHDVAVHLRLSVLKAKQANWIVEIYNQFQSDKGVTIIKSDFRKSDITEAIEMVEFPEQEPF